MCALAARSCERRLWWVATVAAAAAAVATAAAAAGADTSHAPRDARSRGGAVRQAEKVIRYWPKTVEWMKFPEYVWEGREHLEEEESQLARVGKTRRQRGDGQSKRALRESLGS